VKEDNITACEICHKVGPPSGARCLDFLLNLTAVSQFPLSALVLIRLHYFRRYPVV
jgi:hypothetical protein